MLKQPDSHQGEPHNSPERHTPSFFARLWTPRWDQNIGSGEKVDQDLDEQVKSGELDKIFGPADQPGMRQFGTMEPSPPGVYKRVSVHTFRRGDGKIEERHTIEDGSGKSETTVWRTLGDQAHVVTSKRDKNGIQTKDEKYSENMDENDKANFERRWQTPAVQGSKFPKDALIIPPDKETRSIFRNLFGIGFPGFPKSS